VAEDLIMKYMMRIIEFGDSAAVILPDDVIASLKVKEGDLVIAEMQGDETFILRGPRNPGAPEDSTRN
jgi:antitoxin component of MazEF toxin-antitoxin module